MHTSPAITIQLLSDPRYLSGVREFLQAVGNRLGFSDHACGQIALAVDEAICNIIKHGYQKRTDQPIWVHVWPETPEHAPGMTIVLEDLAQQVDPASIKSRDLDEIRPGGLGVHIIKEVMDQTSYELRAGSGMKLTLVKRLAQEMPGSAAPPTTQQCTHLPPASRSAP
jgi:serine/threonine-protein kinase RsbW